MSLRGSFYVTLGLIRKLRVSPLVENLVFLTRLLRNFFLGDVWRIQRWPIKKNAESAHLPACAAQVRAAVKVKRIERKNKNDTSIFDRKRRLRYLGCARLSVTEPLSPRETPERKTIKTSAPLKRLLRHARH